MAAPIAVFLHDGESIPYTPSSPVAAGDVVLFNDLIGIAKVPIPANTEGAMAVRGCFRLPKAPGSGSAIGKGEDVYWDPGNEWITTSGGGQNVWFGFAESAAAAADATVDALLYQW